MSEELTDHKGLPINLWEAYKQMKAREVLKQAIFDRYVAPWLWQVASKHMRKLGVKRMQRIASKCPK